MSTLAQRDLLHRRVTSVANGEQRKCSDRNPGPTPSLVTLAV
jgi:hypothetical protein